MWSIWRRGFGRAWCFGVDRNPSRARPAVRAPSVSGLDPKAMDCCDCDGAGEVDDSRGPSHLVEGMILDANTARVSRQGGGGGLSPLFAVRSRWIFRGESHLSDCTRPNHMGGICSRNSCKSVDGSPPQRQSNGGVLDPARRGHCPCPVATQPAVVIAARCPLPAGSSILLQSASKFDPATNALPVPSSSEQSDACEMPGTPNLRQRSSHQLLATQQLPFMPGLLLRRGGRCPSMPRIMMVCIEHRGRAPIRLAPLTGDGRRLPGIGWTWSLFCRRRDPSPDACLSSGCPRISLSIFCLLSMRAAPHHARTRASWKRAQGPGSRRPPRWGGAALWVV